MSKGNDNNYKMFVVLTIIGAVSALVLASVYTLTKDKIEYEYRLELLRALKVVLPEYNNEPDKDTIKAKDKTVYVAKKDGKIVGYAIQSVSEKGYGGSIAVLLGVSTDGKITGVEILRHAETPGLGSKIEEKWFKDEFKGLTIKDKIAVKKDGGVIDQFSGATISPRAVAEAVKNGLDFVITNVIEGGSK
ncbi:RnfABCDGE type electron transport complex subunit G [Deferribacter thermophilus]|uniref:RnfABCDGE type electron transport complex subunit G n=1 Tax=Deferribacter thermophilus TaxID=53573 RepID=UPI003C24E75F